MMEKYTHIRENRIQKKEYYQQGYRGTFYNYNKTDSSRGHNNSKCVFT